MAGKDLNDPWKGVFGGKSAANGRTLTATVTPDREDSDWFEITLSVQSFDSARPLTGSVRFFLHPTFVQDRPVVPVHNNAAEFKVKSWGAFTVGVIADDGLTLLELDLAEDQTFPALFRSR